uniref:SecY-independent transporter protein n=1 Tax=Nitzschia alba TaxID=2858 RepID=A0A2R4A3F0_NITAL|nr:SecY-independent transporter protein [Nitzschia alba]AVR57591.1 SecY-independent transporter protein [Nitzschia alba]
MISNYYKYYKEIKNRIIVITIAWGISLTIGYSYKEAILFTLIDSNNSFINLNTKPYFIFTNVTEIFYVYLELSIFFANQITVIILVYQIVMFLSLGLYQFEFEKLKFAFQMFVISWLISTILLHKLIIPLSWKFFLSFQNSLNISQPISFFFEARLIEYFHYLTNLYYICLINCQFLAMLITTLTNLNGILKKTFRKLFYLLFVIFSTIITPPDVLSQIFISGSLILIYESLILIEQIKISMVTN